MSGKTRKTGARCIFTCVTAEKIQQAQGQEFGARADSQPRRYRSAASYCRRKSRIGDWEATRLSAPITKALSCRTSSEPPNTPSSPPPDKNADSVVKACARVLCRSLTASKQSLTTMEKSSPLTPKSQPRWGHYPILPSPITRGNAASTNTLTASSGSTSQKVPTSLFCPMPMSKGSRTIQLSPQKDTRLPNPSRDFLQRQKSARCTSLLNGREYSRVPVDSRILQLTRC